jgi:hypothetical protein
VDLLSGKNFQSDDVVQKEVHECGFYRLLILPSRTDYKPSSHFVSSMWKEWTVVFSIMEFLNKEMNIQTRETQKKEVISNT